MPIEDTNQSKLFTLKKWNAVAMWSWDVECDTCAIWAMFFFQVGPDGLDDSGQRGQDTNHSRRTGVQLPNFLTF